MGEKKKKKNMLKCEGMCVFKSLLVWCFWEKMGNWLVKYFYLGWVEKIVFLFICIYWDWENFVCCVEEVICLFVGIIGSYFSSFLFLVNNVGK